MNHRLRFLTVAPALLLAACSDPVAPSVTPAALSTDRSSFASGDHGTLTLRNTDPLRILGVHWCVIALQRREGDAWIFVRGDLSGWEASGDAAGTALSCFSSLQLLVGPRRAVETPWLLGFLIREAEPGAYRVALGVEEPPGGRRGLVFSNAFDVVERDRAVGEMSFLSFLAPSPTRAAGS